MAISEWPLDMNAPQVLELPLDDALLKVLSSESRREILRLLAERRMTGAEMATRLNLGKPAVSEHLKKLIEAGLIERLDDPERRWVYYNLSARGKSILEPQRVRFYLVMAVASLALVVGMALALGLMVFLQHGATGAAPATQSGMGGGFAAVGSDASAGQAPSIIQAPDHVASAPSASRPLDPVAAAPPAPTFTVVTGITHRPCPLNQDCSAGKAAADPTTNYVLILPNGAIAPPLNLRSVYVYRAAGVDSGRHTITVQAVEAAADGVIVGNLGAGQNATVVALATSASAIPLATGGALVAIAADVQLPPTSVNGTFVSGFSVAAAATGDFDGARPDAVVTQRTASPALLAADTSSVTAGTAPTSSAAPLDSANPVPGQFNVVGAPPASNGTVVAASDKDASRATAAGASPGTTGGLSGPGQLATGARAPSDSALMPLVALLGAAVLFGIVRRRA